MSDLRAQIQQALAAFLPSEASAKAGGAQPLAAAARSLFAALGYTSQRTLALSSVAQFRAQFDASGRLSAADRTALGKLTALHFLFQLTDAELSTSHDLFTDPGVVDGTRIHSYLFFAVELPAGTWSRTDLTAIARALNKPLPMPALVLFKHGLPAEGQAKAGDTLSLAVLHRRLNKTASDRDVLEKATLIKDIRCAAPHRAHVEILADLAFESLRSAHTVTSFVQLHTAWRETLDIQELNKRFYRELQHWYFWALGHVRFPDDAPKDAEDRDSLSLIRLLTRLIFVWFLKEKGLVPENLFDARALPKLLRDFAPANPKAKDSVYYRAILQNLFFATLNQEPDQRGWAREGQNFMAHSLYRHRDDFASAATALDLFKDIPFLNGGLFECLDKDLGEGARPRYVRIDGFSRREDSQPVVPDFLFFGPEQDADLSAFYEEKKSGRKSRPARVRGLIEIFHDFKFTIEENTPLEEDVALDPELLGRVFENLLAAYNPETQVTARKQTGSFYTPREIVDYMTGQALFYALREKVSGLPELDTRLPAALAHDDAPNPFNSAETGRLIAALDDLKILDPACGSGAFPMGVLHRLVHLLQKLDPGNARWKQRQLDKAAEIPDATVRERVLADIEQAFGANELGYGRKLYLIENCLYGVDIQPIAAQITKLRFFISLVVEQRTDPAAPNRGIRPLPNLETKIVAANTLLGIARPGQQLLRNLDIDTKEAELRHVRDEHFLARTPKKKAKCREDDARLRKEIAGLLKDDGWDSDTAKKLSAWDPYDQNAHADFFDNEWMFGLTEGFDVVIGNPPYGASFSESEKEGFLRTFHHQDYQLDSYLLFTERAFGLLQRNGVVVFIIPNPWLTNLKLRKIRRFIFGEKRVYQIVHYSRKVFDAVVDTEVVILGNTLPGEHSALVRIVADIDSAIDISVQQRKWSALNGEPVNIFVNPSQEALITKLQAGALALKELCDVTVGMKPYQVGKGVPKQTRSVVDGRIFDATFKKDKSYRPLLRGRDIDKYAVKWDTTRWIKYGDHLAEPRPSAGFDAPEKIVVRQTGDSIIATLDSDQFVCMNNMHTVVIRDRSCDLRFILALLNSPVLTHYFRWLNPEAGEALAEVKKEHVEKLVVRRGDKQQEKSISKLVDQILAAKRADAGADTSAPEAEIDRHVYALYGLTPAEIQLVEESAAPKATRAATPSAP